MSGWISLHRKAMDHWLYNEPRPHTRREAWEDMVMLTNHEDARVLIKGELIECKRGQSVRSLKSWSKHFKWSIQQVRTFLKLLEADGMINTEGLKYSTRITICKYDDYQNQQRTDNELITNSKLTDNKLITTNNNINNENNENNYLYTSDEVYVNEGKKDEVKSIKIDYNYVRDLWCNSTDLAKVSVMSEKRKTAVKKLLKTYSYTQIHEVFLRVAQSQFLNGANDRAWKADFDWVINFNNFIKITEGKYDNKGRKWDISGRKLSSAEENYIRNTESLIKRIEADAQKARATDVDSF